MKRFLPFIVCIGLLLIGCDRSPPPKTTATAAEKSPFIAMARGRVDVEGGLARVSSPRDGIVAKVDVNIGDHLNAGDEVFTLDTAQAEIARDVAKADVDTALAGTRLMQIKLGGLTLRASRAGEAAKAGAASDQSADDARQALAELRAEIAVSQASLDAAKQKLKQADNEVVVRRIRAPVAGRVIAKNVRVGDAIASAGADLVDILPDGAKIVRAELNESFVAKVAVGMFAEIRSEADPDKTYTARVARIGDVFGPSKLAENAQEITDARDVEFVLTLPETPLRVGQRVQVRITGSHD